MLEPLDPIKERISISSVAARYVKLQKSGSKFKGLCPLHVEKTPSFTLDDSNGRFKCWGCGASGDVIELFQRLECCSFTEAVSRLKVEAGISDVFLTKSQQRALEIENKKRVIINKNFREWKNKLITDLIIYTNAQWAIFRIASRQALENTTEELESQIDVSKAEALKREAALDELESVLELFS